MKKGYFTRMERALWGASVAKDPSAIAVLTCFAVFLVNDLYGFVSWRRMQRAQQS